MSDGLCLVSLRHSTSLFQPELNWGLVSSDHTIFCLMISLSFICLYGAALLCIFSGVASFWPRCHQTQICEEFLRLLSFQDLPLQQAAVCSFARAVRGAVLWPQFIFGSSLEVSQCGQNTSFSKMVGRPAFFSFGNDGVLCNLSCCKIIFIPVPHNFPYIIQSPGLLGKALTQQSCPINSREGFFFVFFQMFTE